MNLPTSRRAWRAFTLVEVLFSTVLLLFIVLVITGMINSTSNTYRRMTGQVSVFQEATNVFDSMTRNLQEATLKTYIDYYPDQAPSNTNQTPPPPTAYERRSDLHFVSGPAAALIDPSPSPSSSGISALRVSPSHAVFFLAPLDYTKTIATPTSSAAAAGGSPSSSPGLDYSNVPGLLTGCGYYISYDVNKSLHIPNLNNDQKKRFRLMRLFEPTEMLETYATTGSTWIVDAVKTHANSRALADNILALFIEPRVTAADQLTLPAGTILAPNYVYDSRAGLDAKGKLKPTPQPIQQNQLPPLVHVTMVAIDEPSGARLAGMDDGIVNSTLFGNAPFVEPTHYAQDIKQLAANMDQMKLNYRIFSSDVPMKGAKWTSAGQ